MSAPAEELRQRLEALAEPGYRDFTAALVPGIDPETMLGVRVPALRSLARELVRRKDADEFLSALPHGLFEENNLHALILSEEPSYTAALRGLEAFLPHVDNWATCDMLRPRAFRRERARLLEEIPRWLRGEGVYTVRFGLEMLMVHFLDEDFVPQTLEWAAGVRSSEYYVNMMIAWYFATALAKQYEAALPYLEERRLDPWTHGKTIQKARESLRIPEERKAYLILLKR